MRPLTSPSWRVSIAWSPCVVAIVIVVWTVSARMYVQSGQLPAKTAPKWVIGPMMSAGSPLNLPIRISLSLSGTTPIALAIA